MGMWNPAGWAHRQSIDLPTMSFFIPNYRFARTRPATNQKPAWLNANAQLIRRWIAPKIGLINRSTQLSVTPKQTHMKTSLTKLTCLAALAVTSLCSAQTTGDYRSVASANWAVASTWETYDGASWNPAVAAPTSAAAVNVVTIKAGTSVTNAASLTMDQIVVEAGATLVGVGNLTVANGTGTDLDILGTFLALGGSSGITIQSGSGVVVESGGVIIHSGSSGACVNNGGGTLQFTSGAKFSLVRVGGTIPTATWDTGSLCEVDYVGDGAKPATAALVQNFGDFVINCPNQTTTAWDFAGQLTNHVGKFTVNFGPNPGALECKLFSGSTSSGNLIIGGDFTINSGQINLASSGGPWSLTLSSNITVAAGADFNVSGSASAVYSMILNGSGIQNYTCNGTNRATKLNWTVNSGSTLNLNNDLPLNAAGRTLTANGTVNLNGKIILADFVAGTGTVRNQGGGTGKLIIGVNNSTNTLDGTLALLDGASGALSLVKGGNSGSAGLLTITAPYTYSGGLIISNGTTMVNNTTGSGSGSGGISVLNGTLGGTGAVTGPVVFTAGTLSPGAGGIGTFTINGSLTLAGARMEIDKSSPTTNDLVTGLSTVTFAGTLIATNIGGSALVAGDAFKLFNASTSYLGSFGSIVPATPDNNPGLAWDTSTLNTDGTLRVVTGVVAPPNLGLSKSGNTLTFSWTEPGFKLQSQTNSLSTGLNTNWGDYPGGGTSPVNVTIDPASPSVFFRLSQ